MSLSNTLALTVHDAGYSGKGFVSHICLKFALDFRILQNFKHPSSSSSFSQGEVHKTLKTIKPNHPESIENPF
jgi:hypothetical protein